MNKKNIILILVGILIISMRFNVTFGHINIDVTNDCVGFLLIIIGVLPMINRNSRFKKSGIVAIVGFIASVIAQVINFIDWQEAAHGRAPAVATAVKRLWPDRLVFTYQGDGDLACIGTAETIHALNRGENITIIFINNAIYGMTGRSNGSDHTNRHENRNLSLRSRRNHPRLSVENDRNSRHTGGYSIRHPSGCSYSCRYPQGKESHPQSFRKLDERKKVPIW